LELDEMKKRILIVDDHPDVAKGLAALARGLGYDAHTSFSGEDALTAVRDSPPDALVVDLQMPGVNGWDVVRELRADPAYDTMRIIVCSASDSATYRAKAIEAGAQDYLDKDKAFEELGILLQRQLSGLR
jgi:CheY-like chemotaxis protein